jgi:hypothetical protein
VGWVLIGNRVACPDRPVGCFDDSESHYYSTNASSTKLLLCCGVGPVNCDQPDLNHGWAVANHTQRLAIEKAHKYYLLGSLYFMANDPRCVRVVGVVLVLLTACRG